MNMQTNFPHYAIYSSLSADAMTDVMENGTG